MKFELSQQFFFDAAHTLNREIEREGSRRIHGHTYQAEVTISGAPDPLTGMIVDLGILRSIIAEIREKLDHHLLDEVTDLGIPTMENLCSYISREMAKHGMPVSKISVWRESSGDRCCLTL